MMPDLPVTVEIWSDIVCPFCSIGKQQFRIALESLDQNQKVLVEEKSFFLDPNYQAQKGETAAGSLARHKGIAVEAAQRLQQQVADTARPWGLDFRFDHLVSANSMAAHKLLQAAKSVGLGGKVQEALFHAHFTEGLDIDDQKTLETIGLAGGMSPQLVESAWNDPDGHWAQRAEKEAAEAHELGANGVPFFVFDRKYAVSGAQGPERFLQVLKRIQQERTEARV